MKIFTDVRFRYIVSLFILSKFSRVFFEIPVKLTPRRRITVTSSLK